MTRASLVSPCSQTPQLMGPAFRFEHQISLRNHSYNLRNSVYKDKGGGSQGKEGDREKRNMFRREIHELKNLLKTVAVRGRERFV